MHVQVRGRQTRDRTLEKIRRETSFMARLQASPYVVQLLDKFETEQEVHLVTELCRGGDLRQVVEVRQRQVYSSDAGGRHDTSCWAQ